MWASVWGHSSLQHSNGPLAVFFNVCLANIGEGGLSCALKRCEERDSIRIQKSVLSRK